jgi:parallel beta-helix repeat protein
VGYDGTVIEHGAVRDFSTSIRLDGADQSRVSDVTVNPVCCYGPVVEVLRSNGSHIENNAFALPEGSSFDGRVFVISGSGNSIEDNVARGRAYDLAVFLVYGSHNAISGNASLGLGSFGVQGSRNSVTHNDVVGGDFGGLGVSGARNLIARNSVQGGESPLAVSGPGNVIRKNHSGVQATDSPALRSLVVYGDCRNARVEENVLRNGMSVGECQNARIEDNTLYDVGIALGGGSDNLVRRNTVSGAHAWDYIGIALHGGSDNSIVENTISQAESSGLFVGDGSVGTKVEGNLVRRSGFGPPYSVDNDDGIHVEDPGTVIADNRANFNFDLGIQAVSGVIDGGGNAASGNGNPLQCLNVVCN